MSSEQPVSIDQYAPVRAHCEGEPVHAFGFSYVYAVSPDFSPQRQIQGDNQNPWTKIRPRKSWEISRGKIGSTPAREPRSAANDHQPFLCVHLIDGDEGTMWCSRGQPHPEMEEVWIRIDLPIEARVNAVRLVPHGQGWRVHNPALPGFETSEPRLGQAVPEELTVRVSTDALRWDPVYEGQTPGGAGQAAGGPREIRFAARPVKQVMVTGKTFPQVLNLGYCFSISSLEVMDESGQNLALVSRGAGVTVSSTNTGYGMDRYTQEMLWPIQYDVGYKWARVGYDFGLFFWPLVEQEKGVLSIDSRADAAITEAVRNGVDIVLCLDKGNWLYAPQLKTKDPSREPMDMYYDRPPEPTVSREAMEGWLRYVQYMVRHLRDRVRYYEVMNEWYDLVGTPAEYMSLLEETIPVIRAEQAEAKIIMASASNANWGDFILPCLELGAGPLVDVIAWHGVGSVEEMTVGSFSDARDGVVAEAGSDDFRPHSELNRDGIEWGMRTFADKFADLQGLCRSHGFAGEYLMS